MTHEEMMQESLKQAAATRWPEIYEHLYIGLPKKKKKQWKAQVTWHTKGHSYESFWVRKDDHWSCVRDWDD